MERNLDSIYFRVERDGKYRSVCFSDLTEEEQEKVLKNLDNAALRRMCMILSETIKEIGEACDIIREVEE